MENFLDKKKYQNRPDWLAAEIIFETPPQKPIFFFFFLQMDMICEPFLFLFCYII